MRWKNSNSAGVSNCSMVICSFSLYFKLSCFPRFKFNYRFSTRAKKLHLTSTSTSIACSLLDGTIQTSEAVAPVARCGVPLRGFYETNVALAASADFQIGI